MNNKELSKKLAEELIRKMAEDIVSVQPMPSIDFDALAQSSLWQSFCNRHFDNPSDGDDQFRQGE